MDRYVFNVRRWPRVPARCRVAIAERGTRWLAQTEDLGPGGCQLVSPRVIAAGSEVQLAIATEAFTERLSVLGRIAWTSATAPIRLGVAFSQKLGGKDPRNWFDQLLQAEPALAAAIRRLPDRLPLTAVLYMGQPPRFVIDFTAEELGVLRAVGDHSTIGAVLERVRIGVECSSRAIFSLLARHALVLSRVEAVPAQRWTEVLSKAESALPDHPPAIIVDSVPPQIPTLPRMSEPQLTGQQLSGPHAPDSADPQSRMDARSEAASRKIVAPDQASPPSLRARDGQRRPEAQRLFDQAQLQIAGGGFSEAIALLRRALTLSPRDAEISALLGELAFKNRRF